MNRKLESFLFFKKNYFLLKNLYKNRFKVKNYDELCFFYVNRILEVSSIFNLRTEFVLLNSIFKNNFKINDKFLLEVKKCIHAFPVKEDIDILELKKLDMVEHFKNIFDSILESLEPVVISKNRSLVVKYYLNYIYKYNLNNRNICFFNTVQRLSMYLDLISFDSFVDKEFLKNQIQNLYRLLPSFIEKNFDKEPYVKNVRELKTFIKDKLLKVEEKDLKKEFLTEVEYFVECIECFFDELYSSISFYDVLNIIRFQLKNLSCRYELKKFTDLKMEINNFLLLCSQVIYGEKNVDFDALKDGFLKIKCLIFQEKFALNNSDEKFYFECVTKDFLAIKFNISLYRKKNKNIYFYSNIEKNVLTIQYKSFIAGNKLMYEIFRQLYFFISSNFDLLRRRRDLIAEITKLMFYLNCSYKGNCEKKSTVNYINKNELLSEIFNFDTLELCV